MAKAKKLPSGSWRCLAYSHTESVWDDKRQIWKDKRVYKSFTSDDTSPKGRKEAEAAAATFQAERENENILSQGKGITLGESYDLYIKSKESTLSPSTVREYKHSRKIDFKNLMDMCIDDITQNDIDREISELAKTRTPKTVRNKHCLLSAVLKKYRPDFRLRTELPKRVRPKIHVPSDSEIRTIMEYLKNDDVYGMEIPVLLAAFGPLRRSEICALRSDHIKGNTVHVEYAMVMDENNNWVIKKPKSFAGDRYIVFPDFVINKLKGINGHVTELTPTQITTQFAAILRKNNIQHFRFHDLRHYCASVQHALGIPDAYIMQRGGWGNDMVLKNVYRHVLEEHTAEMNKKANDHFSQLCNTKCNTK